MKKTKTITVEEAFKRFSQSQKGAKEIRAAFGNDTKSFSRAKTEFKYGQEARKRFSSMKEARAHFRDTMLKYTEHDAWQRKHALKETFEVSDLRWFNNKFKDYIELENNLKIMKLTDSGKLALDYEIAGYYNTVIGDQVLAKVYNYYSAESPVEGWRLIEASEVGL